MLVNIKYINEITTESNIYLHIFFLISPFIKTLYIKNIDVISINEITKLIISIIQSPLRMLVYMCNLIKQYRHMILA